jgi:hypothetical protein
VTQEIKIPVKADTAGAEKGLDGLASAGDGIAQAMSGVAHQAKAAADQLERVSRVQQAWRTKFGRDITDSDAGRVISNFERKRGLRGPMGAGFRTFEDIEGWIYGHDATRRTRRSNAEYSARSSASLLEGTQASRDVPSAPPSGGGGGGGGGGASDYSHGARRIASTAMGFGRSMLALAGIGSMLAMANRAKDLATEEAVGNDTLKRRMGDLGVSFDYLRQQARAAGDGLGVTYVESMRFTTAYSKEVGNLGATDLNNQSLSHRMRGIYGFSRAFGVDPGEGTQFFGQMARYGVGRDEVGQRRLAMLIGDAVARSAYGGKVEDFMKAIADYTATSARMMLTTPNSGAYANALTSLSSRGLPGLDPESAARILSAADSATRRGGAMGNASLNFSYAALRNFSPGMSPVDAMMVMEGGLFGTSNQALRGPGGRYMGKIKGDDITNFDKMMPLMRAHYGRGGYFLNAVKNHFGLSSMQQAAVLAEMSDKGGLGATSKLLEDAHIDPMMVNAGGLATLGRVANAKGRGDLMGIYGELLKRKDLSDAQKRNLSAAVSGAGGDTEALRRALGGQVAGLSQEETEGSRTRQAITSVTDALTSAGAPLLTVLNVIREAAIAIAGHLVPGFIDTSGGTPLGPNFRPPTGRNGRPNAESNTIAGHLMDLAMQSGVSHTKAAAIVGAGWAESGFDPKAVGDGGKAMGMFQWHADRWKPFLKWAAAKGLDPMSRSAQLRYALVELGGSEGRAGAMLDRSTNIEQAAGAMVDFERPKGYNASIGNYRNAMGWADRLGAARDFAAMKTPGEVAAGQAAAATKHEVEGHVVVDLKHPDGSKQRAKVPLVGKPAAAGRVKPLPGFHYDPSLGYSGDQ